MSYVDRVGWAAGSCAMVWGLVACGAEPVGALGEAEQVGEATSALVVADKVFTDGSGDVKIQVRTCDYPASAATGSRCQYCAVDQGWVMIGGGAEIEGSPSGGRLRSSMPYVGSLQAPVHSPDGLQTCTGNTPNNDLTKDFTAWMARSASASSSSHRLRVYVIGLQISGVTETQLRNKIFYHDSTTSALTAPAIEKDGAGLLLGGGADEVGSNNCYLTESRPTANNTWRGSAYCSSAPGALKVYGIFMDPCISVPGWTNCLQSKVRSVVGSAVSGYGTASVVTPYPWVTTAIGGLGVVNGNSSRYLADLLPITSSTQGVSVTTKEAGGSVTGATTAYSINIIGGRWGTHGYNVVRFANPVSQGGGLSLYRPSGSAPVSLRQRTLTDSAAYRWSLESVGSGQYRLRNSNPASPAQGECAFRQSGTSNVQVGPCGTSSAYKWTFVGDPLAPWVGFKLRNVSSSTCLDNNDSTTADTNLSLAACTVDFSPRQSLYLRSLNWPG